MAEGLANTAQLVPEFPKLLDMEQISSHSNIGLINNQCGPVVHHHRVVRIVGGDRTEAGEYPWM